MTLENQARTALHKQKIIYKLVATPLSTLYGAVTLARRAAFDWGWLPVTALPGVTISVGNLIAGGTGKTPIILEIARLLQAAGGRPVVLSRGYGGSLRGDQGLELLAGRIVSAHKTSVTSRIPDEAALLSRALPDVPVLVGKDRIGGARRFTGPVTHWLIDDGFQHRKLARQIDLVLLDAQEPFANGALLPRGILREPLSSLGRATAVLFTRAARDYPTAEVRGLVGSLCPGLLGDARFTTGVPDKDIKGADLNPALEGEVLLAVGIADPERVQESVEAALGKAVRTHFVPDHHDFDRRALLEAAAGASVVLTSAKDYWREPSVFDACARPVGLLELRIDGVGVFLQELLGKSASPV